jgi:hypothetical protein
MRFTVGAVRSSGITSFWVVAAVAQRQPAGRPLAFLRTPFDACADGVDDRGVLELGEHAEHLQHHPAGRGAGVERLGRGAQHDAEPVELLGQLGELAHLSRKTVDTVDEQQIDLPRARELQRLRQPGPLELRAGRAIFLVGNDPPILLCRAERFEPFVLRVQRGGLVLFVGRDAGV